MAMPALKCLPIEGNAIATDARCTPPELADRDFLREVVLMYTNNSDALLEGLTVKATNLGISLSRPATALSTTNQLQTGSTRESSATLDTNHARTDSNTSQTSASTTFTSACSEQAAPEPSTFPISRRRSQSLSFAQYDKYLAQVDPQLDQPKFLGLAPPTDRALSAPNLFGVSTRKSYLGIRNGLSKLRRKRMSTPYPSTGVISCSACRDDFQPDETVERLPCGHTYCTKCLRIMINQSSKDETKMPPRCCTQPIPGVVIRAVLDREDQNVFLKAVQLYSTPWESRVFCSNPSCGEFIPPRAKVDPKQPFQVTCRQCQREVCVMCKRDAHPLGYDCPSDTELEAVLKIGEDSGWRRCYKCRNLVELTQGCSHMTCRCKAQFCYVCGGVWDATVGCTNFCNGEEILEHRRTVEAARRAAREAEEAMEKLAAEKEETEKANAEKRTLESPRFQALRNEQVQEMERFQAFEKKTKWLVWTRQTQQKLTLLEKQAATMEQMKERHLKTTASLEDRQVQAELELRHSLEQSERNVRVRLKHMEAYCDGIGNNPDRGSSRKRVVTDRNLRELGQQYNLEKNMKQLHQAKINVMRDRQAKALEELMLRQESELESLTEKKQIEIENIESLFADEEDVLAMTFGGRRHLMGKRWDLSMQILQKELEAETDLRFSVLPPLEWPQEKDSSEDGLSAVEE